MIYHRESVTIEGDIDLFIWAIERGYPQEEYRRLEADAQEMLEYLADIGGEVRPRRPGL